MKYIFKMFSYSVLTFLILCAWLIAYMTWMPSANYNGALEKNVGEVNALEANLKIHVQQLSKYKVGRNFIVNDTLAQARDYISTQFVKMKLAVSYQSYELYQEEYSNIIVDIPAESDNHNVLVIGAHYDSVVNSPGANDNASGVAALIEIGRYFKQNPPAQKVRLIAFSNEEPPYFQTDEMGSLVYAKSIDNDDETVLGMISLETIGYYTNQPGSQKYPKIFNLLYPDTGNFISFIGNLESRTLLTKSLSIFREFSNVPSEGVASPAFVPGVSWSDHWSFWVTGKNAIMITDTAPYRYEHYHETTDTYEKLNYQQYSKVVYGLIRMIEGLVSE